MSDSNSTSSARSVFEQIEDALGATAPGRAFLAECERRARAQETGLLLDAVARLERRGSPATIDSEELRSLIGQLELAIRDARLALTGSLAPARERRASVEPPTVVTFGRETTTAIAESAEAIQDTAWRMREAGFDATLCDRLEAQISNIYAACRRQERMLDGLGTIERTIGRADAFLGELRRAVSPTQLSTAPLVGTGLRSPIVNEDIEFVHPGKRAEPD